MTIIIFIAILIALVLVHEFGHFLSAKLFGVKVQEFGIGFPPKIASVKRGETEYSLNALPLGGFVRIFGEEGEAKKDQRSFASRPGWQRFVIIASGVIFNILFAFIIFWIGFSIGFPTALGEEEVGGTVVNQKVQILEVAKGSPAQSAGLKEGDIIVKIQNPKSKIQKDIRNVENLQQFTNDNKGEKLMVTIYRGERVVKTEVLVRQNPPEGQGGMGLVLADIGLVKYPLINAFLKAGEATFETIFFVFTGIYLLLKNLIISAELIGDVSGPVGIAVLTGQFYTLGIHYLVFFLALMSINLAVLNILPIPALDGGRLLFIGIEKLKGSPLKPEIENKIHAVGFALLIGLVVLVTIRDILQL